MGSCQSAPDPVAPPENKSVSFKGETKAPKEAHPVDDASEKTEVTLIPPPKGYSSGASSEDQSNHSKVDRVGLEEIKTEISENGELVANVVRMETPFGKQIEEVYDGVHTGEVLGSGVSGIARLVTHKGTGAKYAVKCLDLGLVKNEEGLTRLREEIYIMCQLDHPNIVRLEQVYESETEIYLVMELCSGGDLFDRLDEQPDYHYTEAQCARLIKHMLSSLRYLHSKEIIHRDLKLENFLFSTREPDSVLKMIDFGLSKHFHYGEVLHDAVGTPYSVAPEIIEGSYNEKVDLWAIGVITYLLLSGETPFGGCDGECLQDVRNRIMRGEFEFMPEELWDDVSDLGKDFVRSCLNVDPSKRPSAKEAQRHMWIQTWSKKEGTEGNKLDPKVARALVKFKELSDMQKLLAEVLSFTLLPEQITELRKEFEKMDRDNDGELTLSELKQVMMESAEAGSLGALTEKEIDDIFNALRVKKSESTIRWHEFIAAGLSQCKVDDRNLRLAFDRLDTDEKGFITLDNVMALLSSGCDFDKEHLQTMWEDTLKEVGSSSERITFEDFVVLMKGPTKEAVRRASLGSKASTGKKPVGVFAAIPEGESNPERLSWPPEVTPRPLYRKQRSRSLGETRSEPWYDDEEEDESGFATPPRRPSLISMGRSSPVIERKIKDESKTPLSVHRTIYRAHREMRNAVLDASKRFEEEKEKRDQATLAAQRGTKHDTKFVRRASLRRRMERDKAIHISLVEDANNRSGRSRRKRHKTMSDMTGMMRSTPTSKNPSSE